MSKVIIKNLNRHSWENLHDWLEKEMPQPLRHRWVMSSVVNPHTFESEARILFIQEEDAIWFSLRWL